VTTEFKLTQIKNPGYGDYKTTDFLPWKGFATSKFVKSYDYAFTASAPASVWVTNELTGVALLDEDGATFTCIAGE
jgi:hypothetical protein